MIINPGMRRSGARRFSPAALFAASETGVWYDPSDLTTLFQDTAGTTPVTTPGQTVALMLDKSRVQSFNTPKRNLLRWTEDFSNAVWTNSGITILANNAVAPDGTTTADKLSSSGTIAPSSALYQQQNAGVTTYTYSLYAKADGANFVYVFYSNGGVDHGRYFDLTTGVAGNTVGTITGSSVTNVGNGWFRCSITFTGNGLFPAVLPSTTNATGRPSQTGTTPNGVLVWGAQIELGSTATAYQRIDAGPLPTAWLGTHATQATAAARPTYGIEPMTGRRNLLLATDTLATQSVTVTAVAHTLSFTGTGTVTLTGASIAGPLIGTGAGNRVSLTFTPTAGSLTLTVVGSVTLAQLELGSTATAYQRVTTQFDVTEAGVASKSYLRFDGVDDGMATSAINFTATDKMTVFGGVRKLSDAGGTGMLVEFTSGAFDPTQRSFFLAAPGYLTKYTWRTGGTSNADVNLTDANLSAPITNVLTGVGDIASDTSILRVNGVQRGSSSADQGTGNFTTAQLFIGRRGGTMLQMNGQIYSLIVRGAATDAATITSTETWVNSRTGAY